MTFYLEMSFFIFIFVSSLKTNIMREMSETEKLSYKTKCSAIEVTVYDLEKVTEELNKQLGSLPQHKDQKFQLRDKKLALVNGQDIITDTECCFYADLSEGLALDVYRADEKVIKDGKEVTKWAMFPTCTVTLTLEQLEPYIKEKTTLDLFMGDRFIYNHRIVGNIDFMISNFK